MKKRHLQTFLKKKIGRNSNPEITTENFQKSTSKWGFKKSSLIIIQ